MPLCYNGCVPAPFHRAWIEEKIIPKLILETTQMAGVPVLTICPEGVRRCPPVFFAHGMTGRKEDGIPLGYRLATAGCFWVAPDALLNGERLDDRIRYLGRPGAGQTCPPETGALAEHLAGDPRVGAARLGVTGVSMGGHLAFYLAAHDPRVRACRARGRHGRLAAALGRRHIRGRFLSSVARGIAGRRARDGEAGCLDWTG
jgi:dienelactone hydrolase